MSEERQVCIFSSVTSSPEIPRVYGTNTESVDGNGLCHTCKYLWQALWGASAGRRSVSLEGSKAEVRWWSLPGSSNTYEPDEVNVSEPLWGHREVTLQAAFPGACHVERRGFPVLKSCSIQAAAYKRACKAIRWVCVHFTLYIIPVLNLLEGWA